MTCTPQFSTAIARALGAGHVAHGWAPRFEVGISATTDGRDRPVMEIEISYAGSETPGISYIDAPRCPCDVIVASHTDERLTSTGAAELITELTGISFYGEVR